MAGDASGPAPSPNCAVTTENEPEQLCAVWTDPSFDPAQRAFYYARVLENPTCRWSTAMCRSATVDCSQVDEFTGTLPSATAGYEGCCSIALSNGRYVSTPRFDTVEERAYTSPVWVNP